MLKTVAMCGRPTSKHKDTKTREIPVMYILFSKEKLTLNARLN